MTLTLTSELSGERYCHEAAGALPRVFGAVGAAIDRRGGATVK